MIHHFTVIEIFDQTYSSVRKLSITSIQNLNLIKSYAYPFNFFVDAAIVGQLRLVKMLVERGADPSFKNRKGKTPCDVAAAAVHNFLTTSRGECNVILYIHYM